MRALKVTWDTSGAQAIAGIAQTPGEALSPRNGQHVDAGAAQAKPEDLQAETARLREENAKLLEQREVLKKSLGILSEMPPRGMPKSKP